MGCPTSNSTIRFNAYESRWEYDTNNKSCNKIDPLIHNEKISPDGKKAAFVRNSNLWVKEIKTKQERALTDNGEKFYVYGSNPTIAGNVAMPVMDFLWSPDSARILTHVIDTRDVSLGNPIVEYVHSDGSLRPVVLRSDRRVAYLSDEQYETWKILAIDVETGRVQKADYKSCPITYPHYMGYFNANRGWWDADSRHAYFIYHESDCSETRVLKWDTFTGKVNLLFEECSAHSTAIIPAIHTSTLATPLPQTGELIWYSERSGWSHLYLYDAVSGKLKNAITNGNWVVRNILHCDMERRELIIQTAGRIEGRNPYYRDICRVHIDTGKLTTLLSSDHEYVVADKKILQFMLQKTSGVSPCGRYIVTTRSRVDNTPVSLLLNRDGDELLQLYP
ncbi:DPP IV N-terminal domain-containing protein [bacterium AH-315-K03]|nr:DPP IV N-terminal domain-containing protein [bacterium AH-315-K03]